MSIEKYGFEKNTFKVLNTVAIKKWEFISNRRYWSYTTNFLF